MKGYSKMKVMNNKRSTSSRSMDFSDHESKYNNEEEEEDSKLQATVKRVFSMRRSSSVSEKYLRIHDQTVTVPNPFDDHEEDGEKLQVAGSANMEKKLKKKNKKSVLNICTDGEPVKFLCSHGGNILPHPADGRLKYTGGDTRVISIHRHFTFHELMKKVTSMFNGEMILKYQLTPEDYEVLVTVKSDEDVRHMIDECDRLEHIGGPRLRAFLFPSNPIVMVNHLEPTVRHSLEQQYVNSINGIVVQPSPVIPRTQSETTTAIATNCGTNAESATCHGRPSSLARTRSSPSLCNQVATASPNLSQNHHHHHQPPPKPQPQPHPHNFHKQHYQPPKPSLDRHPHKSAGSEHLGMMRSTGAAEYYSHGTNRGGQMYSPRGPPYDAYNDGDCGYDGTGSPSLDVSSSSHSMRSGR